MNPHNPRQFLESKPTNQNQKSKVEKFKIQRMTPSMNDSFNHNDSVS
jgi:hypothetical protein